MNKIGISIMLLGSVCLTVNVATNEAACGSDEERLQGLQEAVNALCGGGTAVTVPTVRNTWTSVPITHIGGTNMRHPNTFSYVIPSVIPSTAKNVLVYATIYTSVANAVSQHIKVFTQDGSDRHYEKYLYSFSTTQHVINIPTQRTCGSPCQPTAGST